MALPYETKPAALSFHSAYRKSIAFLSAPDMPWLYSGATNTKPSKPAIFAAHFFVCGFSYRPSEGGTGSSSRGSA